MRKTRRAGSLQLCVHLVICHNQHKVPSVLAYDRHVEQLFEVLRRFRAALEAAGIPYRIVGGMAAYLHVSDVDPIRARLTRDVDVAIDRADLDRIADAVRDFEFEYRQVAGVDLLVDRTQPKTRSAIHFVFVRERVRPTDVEPTPDFSTPATTDEGFLLVPVADLVRMKLISFRLKDQVHLQDLDSVGLITPGIEEGLSPELRDRLRQVRAAV